MPRVRRHRLHRPWSGSRATAPHLERAHPPGARRVVSGKVERDVRRRAADRPSRLSRCRPSARRDSRRSRRSIRPPPACRPRTVRRLALEALERAPDLPEWQDPAWLARQRLAGLARGARALHAPTSRGRLSPAAAASPAARLRRTARPPAGPGPAQGGAPAREPAPAIAASELARAARGRPALRASPAPRRARWRRSAATSPPASG